MTHPLIIVGGGPAGLTAAEYAGRARVSSLLLEKMLPGGQLALTETVENYPGAGPATGPLLAGVMEGQARASGADFVTNTEVLDIGLENRIFLMKTDRETYRAKAVIVATGASPRRLGVPGETKLLGRGVSYCALCDGPFFKGKRVAVVGGGDSAVKEAFFLSRFARHVTLIHRRERLRSERIHQERILGKPGFSVLWNSVVEEIRGESRVEALKVRDRMTGNESLVEIDGVFIYIGLDPQTRFVHGLARTDPTGYLLTDEKLQTSCPGLFGAGDVRVTPLRQIATAVGDGALAATMAIKYLEVNFPEGRALAGPVASAAFFGKS